MSLLDEFIVVGISHWYAEVSIRERFALPEESVHSLLKEAESLGLDSLIVLSTCNRTEIFTRGDRAEVLFGLMVKFSNGTRSEVEKFGFVKKGTDAVRHFFQVAVGLDAQILGDLQIIQQVKQAYEIASASHSIDGTTHRLMQSVFRAHKRSRAETSLGSGAATTAYAAVQASAQILGTLHDKHVLLVGTGEVGKVTCMNLVAQGVKRITLINRSQERAELIAGKYDVEVAGWEQLTDCIRTHELVIVATGAPDPVITKDVVDMSQKECKVFMDLAVPRNVDPSISENDHFLIVNMDMLNDRLDATYKERQSNIPLVEAILDEEIADFEKWLNEQRLVPTIRALTRRLDEIRTDELARYRHKFSADDALIADQLTRRIVNKILAYSIDHLKEDHERPEDITKMVQSLFKIEPDA